jgi:hypothetical protein
MFGNIIHALAQIKSDVAQALEASLVTQLCVELGHQWRKRELDPVTTVRGFLLQLLHGNTACSHVPHLLGKSVRGHKGTSLILTDLAARFCHADWGGGCVGRGDGQGDGGRGDVRGGPRGE